MNGLLVIDGSSLFEVPIDEQGNNDLASQCPYKHDQLVVPLLLVQVPLLSREAVTFRMQQFFVPMDLSTPTRSQTS